MAFRAVLGFLRENQAWPKKLGITTEVLKSPEFSEFEKLRDLRNNLVHPRLVPTKHNPLTQDQLLKEVSAKKAKWAVAEVKKMGRVMFTAFKVDVPKELDD